MPVSLPTDLPGWTKVKQTLHQFSSTEDIEQMFTLFVRLQQDKYQKSEPPALSETPFEELKMFFQTVATREETHTFSTVTVQTIAVIAAQLDTLVPEEGIKFCPSQKLRVNRLNRKLVGSLMANAFLCLFPDSEDCNNTINFDWFFESVLERKSQQGKLRCILHYFERLSTEWEGLHSGTVSFLRVVIPPENVLSWQGMTNSKHILCPLSIIAQGAVDDSSSSYLKVIPSEKEVGAGMLHSGCLQEEAMFSIYPELIVSKLFMGEMAANEAMHASGFSRYSKYSGYGATFKYAGDFNDASGKDKIGEVENAIVAIDFLTFKQGERQQYGERETLREINKAFAGFLQPDTSSEGTRSKGTGCETWSAEVIKDLTSRANVNIRPIATSQYGCGVFGGDPQLKCVIQWLAASQAGCPELLYYTLDDDALNGLQYITTQVKKRKWRVGKLAQCVHQYCERVSKGKEKPWGLLAYMRDQAKSDASCVLL